MYLLLKDGITDMYREFVPCKSFDEFEGKYKNAFRYCKKNINKLDYLPKESVNPCKIAEIEVMEFIKNIVKMIYFKGGTRTTQRDLYIRIGIKTLYCMTQFMKYVCNIFI